MCLKHCVEIPGGCIFHQAKSNDCEPADENEQPEPEYAWADYEPPVDNEGFGYEELRQALQVSLTEQGLEVPSVPPPGLPSIHELLESVPGPTPSESLALVPSQPSDNPPPVCQQMHSIPSTSLRKPSKAPRITNQLDPMWTLDLRARAQQEINEGRIVERRKEMERAAKQRFILNWFDADDVPVTLQWVSNCPFFPQYQLTDDPLLVESLGTGISKIEVYEECFARWIPALLSHTFTLTTGGHIFIRRCGVTRCEDFDKLYMASKQSVRPPHMRSNMKGQRDALRATLKQPRVIVVDNSDSDVEFVEAKPLISGRVKRQRYSSPSEELEAPTPSRQRLYSVSPPHVDMDSLTQPRRRRYSSPSEELDAPAPSCRRLYSASPSHMDMDFADRRAVSMSPTPDMDALMDVDFNDRFTLSLSPTPPLQVDSSTSASSSSPSPLLAPVAPSVIPVHVPIYHADIKREVWPYGMYTIDMATGFHQLDNPRLCDALRQEELFERIFDVPYVKATYHQNHRAWIDADPTIWEAHERAGRKSAGLWKNFLSTQRAARGAQIKKSKSE